MKPAPPPATPARVIHIRTPYARLDEKQLRAALSSCDDNDPRLIAHEQLLDEELAAAMLEVSSPGITDSARAHAAGRIDALATLKNRVHELRDLKV